MTTKTKIKTIKLSDGITPLDNTSHNYTSEKEWRKSTRFRVEQITDSIEYYTGQLLERSDVESLCASKDWKVTIVQP